MTFSNQQLQQIRRLVSTAIAVLEEQRGMCREEARAAKVDLKAGRHSTFAEAVQENINELYKAANKIDGNVRKLVSLQHKVKAEIKREVALSQQDENFLIQFDIESRTLSNLFVHPTLLMKTMILKDLLEEYDN